MDKKNMLDRLSVSLGSSNDTELSKVIDVARATVGTWRSRGTIPIDKLCKIAEKHDLSLDYLYFGKITSPLRKLPHPGFYGYLLGKILDKLSQNDAFKSYNLYRLGEFGLLIYDQIDLEAGYPEQLKRIDEIIEWLVEGLFSTELPQVNKDTSEDIKRIVEIINEEIDEGFKGYCLKCNFDDQSTTSLVNYEDFKLLEIENIYETSILTGDVRFTPNKPNQNFFDSIINLNDFFDMRKSMLRVSKGWLRDEVDKLINQGLDIKPEYLKDPTATGLLQKRIAAQEADKDVVKQKKGNA